MIDGEEGKEKPGIQAGTLHAESPSMKIEEDSACRVSGWYCVFKTHLNTKLYIMSSQFRSSNVWNNPSDTTES